MTQKVIQCIQIVTNVKENIPMYFTVCFLFEKKDIFFLLSTINNELATGKLNKYMKKWLAISVENSVNEARFEVKIMQ